MRFIGITLLIACGLSACAARCSYGDADIVVAQWQDVSSPNAGGKTKLTSGQAVFHRLFELDPGAKALFGRVNVADFNSPEFSGHIMRVMGGLDILMNYMHNQPALESMLAHLATQHSVRPGVTTAGFDVMATVLMESMPQVVEGFNTDAWRNCLIPILDGISAGLP